MRYAQLVIGPAGSGKSTYCSAMANHCETQRRKVDVINLDPAAEAFDYQPTVDIRELISVGDVMEDDSLRLGPNGGLMFCMEYLVNNFDWLKEELGDVDDDYMLIDLPGQIELYTHSDVVKKLIKFLTDCNFRVCAVFIMDSQFLTDVSKFFSGVFVALSAMVACEIAFVNVLSKIDLLNRSERKLVDRFLEPLSDVLEDDAFLNSRWGEKYKKLTSTLANLIDEYALVKFTTMNINDEDSLNDVLLIVDNAIQYGEDADVRVLDQDYGSEDHQNGVVC